jgi:hypothetical protein
MLRDVLLMLDELPEQFHRSQVSSVGTSPALAVARRRFCSRLSCPATRRTLSFQRRGAKERRERKAQAGHFRRIASEITKGVHCRRSFNSPRTAWRISCNSADILTADERALTLTDFPRKIAAWARFITATTSNDSKTSTRGSFWICGSGHERQCQPPSHEAPLSFQQHSSQLHEGQSAKPAVRVK